jgi:hypothetical protein
MEAKQAFEQHQSKFMEIGYSSAEWVALDIILCYNGQWALLLKDRCSKDCFKVSIADGGWEEYLGEIVED